MLGCGEEEWSSVWMTSATLPDTVHGQLHGQSGAHVPQIVRAQCQRDDSSHYYRLQDEIPTSVKILVNRTVRLRF